MAGFRPLHPPVKVLSVAMGAKNLKFLDAWFCSAGFAGLARVFFSAGL